MMNPGLNKFGYWVKFQKKLERELVGAKIYDQNWIAREREGERKRTESMDLTFLYIYIPHKSTV